MATITGKVYTTFDPIVDPNIPSDDIVPDKQKVSAGLWSGNAGILSSYFLDGVQSASSGVYYLNVHNLPTSSVSSEVQFAIAYGNAYGSGSLILNQQYPTRAIYSQYKNVLLDPTDDYFTIGSSNKAHIIVINMQRARIKEKIDPGNWELDISGSGPTHNMVYKFIDDSGETTIPSVGRSGRIFNIVSGSIASGVNSTTSVGLVYPDMGLLVFDPDIMSSSYGVVCNVSSSDAVVGNHETFYKQMVKAVSSSFYFTARNEEEISSTHYFVRAKNRAMNFSNNPTFVSGTYGDFYNQNFVKNPTVYVTSVGLYNDNNELLAVAKLSQPLKKTFTREISIRIKLDF